MKKKILHIGNTAGVASTLAKFTNKQYEARSWVITRKRWDTFGLTTFGETIDTRASIFKAKVLMRARTFDLLHVHSFDELISSLKMLHGKKPLVMHYHGTDIRGKWREQEKSWKRADLILVSTPNLLEGAPRRAIHLPNPIDFDFFYSRGKNQPNTAFHISYNRDSQALALAKQFGLTLTIHDRNKNPIPYSQFPEVLSNYEYYIDVKGIPNYDEKMISKTAIEALACGCKVIREGGEVIQEFPKEYNPFDVVKKLWKLYQLLLRR
ncbi:MAG: hypothetical protein ACFFCW_19625 [Candidatus Hodarchaeota archaeon]